MTTARSITVELDDAQHQMLMLALACLAHERPGWHHMIHEFAANNFASNSAQMLWDFHQHHPRHPHEDQDSIMQLREAVEAKHPMLWQMVRELVWPS